MYSVGNWEPDRASPKIAWKPKRNNRYKITVKRIYENILENK